MAALVISYDLNREGSNYAARDKAVIEKIKSLSPTWWHGQDSTWLIVTNAAALNVANAIWAIMGAKDNLLVAPLAPGGAYAGFTGDAQTWLKDNLP